MDYIIRIVALLLPLVIGYFRYDTQSDLPGWRDFVGWAVMGGPFSVGLWLSTTEVGKKYWPLTLALLIPSTFVHMMILTYFHYVLPITILVIELYAIYQTPRRRKLS